MATKTIDDIQPKAVMSPTEQGRWGSLPPDEQLVLGSVPHAVRARCVEIRWERLAEKAMQACATKFFPTFI